MEEAKISRRIRNLMKTLDSNHGANFSGFVGGAERDRGRSKGKDIRITVDDAVGKVELLECLGEGFSVEGVREGRKGATGRAGDKGRPEKATETATVKARDIDMMVCRIKAGGECKIVPLDVVAVGDADGDGGIYMGI